MAFFTVNEKKMHYELYGQGDPVLFINGIGADLNNPIGAKNSPLPGRFCVLAFDPRGLGESESERLPQSIAEMAEDAYGLASALGWNRFHVFGASMGGMVAQELALLHPEAVNRLVIGVTNAGGENAGPQVLEMMDDMPIKEVLRLSDTRQDEAWAEKNPEIVRGFEQRFRALVEQRKANPVLARGYNNQMQAAAAHNTFPRLPLIQTPTLVFAGLYDASNPVSNQIEMAKRIPGAKLLLLQSGHGTWYQDREAWSLMIEFLLG